MNISAAGKAAIVEELLHPPIYNQDGVIIGYGEPLISREDAINQLNMKMEEEK